MPSSATTVLRLEKPASGEKAGTWGTIANLNYDMLEASIAGAVTISTTSGTVVLTNVDYTNDQAKKAVLYCDGALVGNLIIEIPNASKTYRVINNTTNAYTVSVKTNAGSAKAVTQGAAVTLYCNGSNTIYYVSPEAVIGTGAPNTAGGAAASSVAVTATGNLSSTNAQAALAELQGDIDTINTALGTKQPLDADLTAIAALSNTKGNIIVGGNASAWTALSVGTNGLVMRASSVQSTGVQWAAGAPTTTYGVFYQTAAPTGWTKQTDSAFNDRAVRITTGTVTNGGSTGFTTVFTARTITQANLPNVNFTVGDGGHDHDVKYSTATDTSTSGGGTRVTSITSGGGVTGTDAAASNTTGIIVNSGGSDTAMDFAVKYLDMIVAQAD